MNIIVTGCAGFIGSRVSELLLDSGYNVFGVDNLNDAYDPRLKEWRLSNLLSREGFLFKKVSICDRKGLENALDSFYASTKGKGFDAFVNFAAMAGVRMSTLIPEQYFDTNLTGTLNTLELCRKFRIPRFVQASTSSVYGENRLPFKEDQPTDRPLSPYAASKKAAELLCYTYSKLYGINVAVLRYFTVYGPAGRPDMSPFRFIKWIAEGEELVLYGDGFQTRDFTYVDDIALGTLKAITTDKQKGNYDIFNLGSGNPEKLNTLISVISNYLGKKAKIVYKPSDSADVSATWADVTKARDTLGWRPSYSLKEGIKKTIDWYIDNREWVKDIKI